MQGHIIIIIFEQTFFFSLPLFLSPGGWVDWTFVYYYSQTRILGSGGVTRPWNRDWSSLLVRKYNVVQIKYYLICIRQPVQYHTLCNVYSRDCCKRSGGWKEWIIKKLGETWGNQYGSNIYNNYCYTLTSNTRFFCTKINNLKTNKNAFWWSECWTRKIQ